MIKVKQDVPATVVHGLYKAHESSRFGSFRFFFTNYVRLTGILLTYQRLYDVRMCMTFLHKLTTAQGNVDLSYSQFIKLLCKHRRELYSVKYGTLLVGQTVDDKDTVRLLQPSSKSTTSAQSSFKNTRNCGKNSSRVYL